MRITIRVKPRSGRPRVGGRHGPDSLVVAVAVPPVEGRATAAALAALAQALAVPTSTVSLVSGRKSRTKIVEVPDSAAESVVRLLSL